ncbi:MAG: hypothetical protein SGARI_004646 [Bacillariaceae sp.]
MKGNLRHNKYLRLSRDLITLVVVQAGQMLYQSQAANPHYSLTECMKHAYTVLDSGKALKTFRQMMLAQGSEPEFLSMALETPQDVPLAKYVATWQFGTNDKGFNQPHYYIHDIPAKTIGNISVMIGAGRTMAGQTVDAQAGLVFSKQVGYMVEANDAIVTIYTNISQELANQAMEAVQSAITITSGQSATVKGPIVTHIVDSRDGTRPFAVPDWLESEFAE